MATFFEQVLLRLKEQLQRQSDKEVANALGMSPTAFNDRKKRDAFPEEKLLALSVKQPELKLDVNYILTGERVSTLQRQQLSVLTDVVAQINDPKLSQKLVDAKKQLEKQAETRRPVYADLVAALEICTDDDVELVISMARRLAASAGQQR